MNTKPTRKEKLEMLLAAIELPLLVVEVEHNNIKYKPKNYQDLKLILEEELKTLSIEVNI